jgi:hypothetical protein
MDTMIQVGEWLVGIGIGWFGGRRTKNRAIRVENHDRYLAVRNEFVKLFNLVQFFDKITQEDLLLFKGGTHEAVWMFGPEIKEYADDVFKHGRNFWLTHEQLKEMGMPPEKRAKIVKENGDEWAWFYAQYKVLDAKFIKYLKLSN